MREFIKGTFSNLLAGLVVMAGPLIVAALALIQSVPWYLNAIATFAAPGAVLWSLTQASLFWKTKRQTIERSEKIVESWLMESNLTLRREPLPSVAYWRYIVTLPMQQDSASLPTQPGRNIAVYRSRERPEHITFGVNMLVPEADYPELDKLTNREGSVTIHKLRLAMANFGIQFQGINAPLRTVSLFHEISFDASTTKKHLIEQLLFAFRAYAVFTESLYIEAVTQGVQLIGTRQALSQLRSGTASSPKPTI